MRPFTITCDAKRPHECVYMEIDGSPIMCIVDWEESAQYAEEQEEKWGAWLEHHEQQRAGTRTKIEAFVNSIEGDVVKMII